MFFVFLTQSVKYSLQYRTALDHQEITHDQGVVVGADHVDDPEVVADHQTAREDEAARLLDQHLAVEVEAVVDLAHLNVLAQGHVLDQRAVVALEADPKHQLQNVALGQDQDQSQNPRHLLKIKNS